jgi:hypothetical protein
MASIYYHNANTLLEYTEVIQLSTTTYTYSIDLLNIVANPWRKKVPSVSYPNGREMVQC